MPTPSRQRLPALAILSVSFSLACDGGNADVSLDEGPSSETQGDEPAEPIDLFDPGAWLATPSELDPLADHRPDPVICPTAAYGLEFGVLEVDTGQCNYLSVSQPLAHAIAAGDRLRVTVWWQTLIADPPAEGHLALVVDEQLLWETSYFRVQYLEGHRRISTEATAGATRSRVIFSTVGALVRLP